MDFIEGRTLQEHLKETGPLTWETAKALFLPVMQALEQVHRKSAVL